MQSTTRQPKPKRKAGAVAYGTSPTKRRRRSKADIQAVRNAIFEVVEEYRPMTVRQVFYQLVSKGEIGKSEREYKSTVCRLLADMRRDGTIPFEWIADSTRWMRKPTTYSGLRQMLAWSQQTYRRSIWDWQDCYVEIWLEKEALAGVLVEVTDEWDVPLMVTRGYPSISFVHAAAEAIEAQEKPAHLYYFGDHDPSGVDIDRFVEQQIREIAPGVDMTFQRVAVMRGQIDELGLQTRPTKRTDSRSKNFQGESVEVDAIAPGDLREICRGCIERHVDPDVHNRMMQVEKAERGTLAEIVEKLEGAA